MSKQTSQNIAKLVEFGEARAWANYYRCAPAEFAAKFRVSAEQVSSAWVTMIPGIDTTFFNRIVGLGINETATESILDEAISILQDAGCNNYMAQVSPQAQPQQLTAWLEARGFVKGRNWAKVYRGDEPAPEISTDLRVEKIGREHAEDFADITLSAFGLPPELRPMMNAHLGEPGWHNYLAFDGKVPVSAASMYISGDVAWLGFGSTLETHRRRGGQSTMFARRIADGLALGCRWFVTETGEDTPEAPNPSFHNMLRSGFKLAYLRPNYLYQSPE